MKKLLFISASYLITANLFAGDKVDEQFTFSGYDRKYSLYIPSSYTGSEAIPLIMMIHGNGQTATEMYWNSGFNEVADTANFIVVYPQGKTGNSGTTWDIWGLTDWNDKAFLMSIIDSVKKSYTIDTNRMYVTGFSQGSFMTGALVCSYYYHFAAIGSAAGPYTISTCTGGSWFPKPYIYFHGTNDSKVPYNPSGFAYGAEPFIKGLVELNDCDTSVSFVDTTNLDFLADAYNFDRIIYNSCDQNAEVRFYKGNNLGHLWLGSGYDINYAVESWNFFRRFENVQYLSSVNSTVVDEKINIYPNPSNGIFTVNLEGISPEKLSVFNSQGALIQYYTPTTTNSFTIDASPWERGVYLLNIYHSNGQFTKKVMLR